MDPEITHRTTCRLCGSSALEPALALTPTPPANAFVGADALATPQKVYPLELFLCSSCGHLQMLDVVNPQVLFEHYVYVSGTSPSFVAHFKQYSEQVIQRLGLKKGDLIVDIGSNDGTLLSFFKDSGFRVLGIDPAREIAAAANRRDIETINDFFTPDLARTLHERYGPAALITANNVFAHVDDLQGILDGVRFLLTPTGGFVFEVSYLLDVYQKVLFDTIYHEHLDYHRVEPLRRFFADNEMLLFDVERIASHGGSLRGYAALDNGKYRESPHVAELAQLEIELELGTLGAYAAYTQQIDRCRLESTSLIRGLKQTGKRIAGYGAPAKATTFLYHFGLGPDLIEFIVDDSPLKQGLYSPGLHIPVVSSQTLYERRPDYAVVLAWNFADVIIRNQSEFTKIGGRFIVPFPQLKVQ